MFAKNDEVKDLKQELKEKDEEIEQLEHNHKIDLARQTRIHVSDKQDDWNTIAELRDRVTVLENLHETVQENKETELELDNRAKQLEARDAELDLKEEGIQNRGDIVREDIDKRKNHLTIRETDLTKQEAAAYKSQHDSGYTEGYQKGFDRATELHLKTSERANRLLSINALGHTQPSTITFTDDGKEKPSESNKILADAFAKHLSKTIDKVLDDSED